MRPRPCPRPSRPAPLQGPYPAPSHADSIGNNEVLDAWRAQLGYATFAEVPATNRTLPGVLPQGLPQIAKLAIPGLANPISNLIIGCDNRNTVAEAPLSGTHSLRRAAPPLTPVLSMAAACTKRFWANGSRRAALKSRSPSSPRGRIRPIACPVPSARNWTSRWSACNCPTRPSTSCTATIPMFRLANLSMR